MKKDISCKCKSKESHNNNTHIRKIYTLNRVSYERQEMPLHYDPGINPRTMYKNDKYLCTQHRSALIHKAKANSHEREINSNTIILGNFYIPLITMDKPFRQKINKGNQTVNDKINQKDLTDMYMASHSKAAEYTFFLSAHRIFSRIGHILGHKSSLGIFEKLTFYQASSPTIMLRD